MVVNVALVRSLYGDLAPDANGDYLFDDTIVASWIELAHGNPYRAAAIACRALAADQNYLLKNVHTDDLTINGTATATEFRLLADKLEGQATKYDLDEEDTFAVVNIAGEPLYVVPEDTAVPCGWG